MLAVQFGSELAQVMLWLRDDMTLPKKEKEKEGERMGKKGKEGERRGKQPEIARRKKTMASEKQKPRMSELCGGEHGRKRIESEEEGHG